VTITAEQVRAARQLLCWTTSKLARHVGASEKAIMAFSGRPRNDRSTQRPIRLRAGFLDARRANHTRICSDPWLSG
jgi:hypothetical protein